MTPNEILIKAVDHYGLENQLLKLAEECAELAVEAHHMADGRTTVDAIAGEMADVQILMDQLFVGMPILRGIVMDRKLEKLERLERRLRGEPYQVTYGKR